MIDMIPFDVDLDARDHTFENIYVGLSALGTDGKSRYGMTVRAYAWPEELRERSNVKHFSQRPGPDPQPLPVIGEAPYILIAGGKKPRVDWRSAGQMRLLKEMIEEARLRNETDDWAFRGMALNVSGHAFEIGQLETYKSGRIPLPPGFKADTLIYTIDKVTLI